MKYIRSIFSALLLATFAIGASQAQDTFDPKLSEQWEPKPRVVNPGDAQKAPSDAIVLFDGGDLSEWIGTSGQPARWKVENGTMTVVPKSGAITTRKKFGDMQLHIEWRTPSEVKGDGQGRGNSGIFLMDRYELQVLDSYENETYPNGQAGSFYKQHIPLVNVTKKPGEWQTYDVIFEAPEFTEEGFLKSPARVTVLHNGVVVQNDVALFGPTEYNKLPRYTAHDKAPITLQDHGNPVSFRNIWVREL